MVGLFATGSLTARVDPRVTIANMQRQANSATAGAWSLIAKPQHDDAAATLIQDHGRVTTGKAKPGEQCGARAICSYRS